MKKKIIAGLLSVTMFFSTMSVYAETDIGEVNGTIISAEAVETSSDSLEKTAEDVEHKESVAEIQEEIETPVIRGNVEIESNEVVTEIPADIGYLSEVDPSKISYINPVGEINVGETKKLEGAYAGKEYQITFKVPATKRYRIYFPKISALSYQYNVFNTITVFDENEQVIAPSEDESWYLTEGETVTINVGCVSKSFDGPTLELRLIEYVGIKNITAEYPAQVIWRSFHTRVPITINIHYTDGESREFSYSSSMETFTDPYLEKSFTSQIDRDGNVYCSYSGKREMVGKFEIIEWDDPSVYQVTETREYIVNKNELYEGKYFCLNPENRKPGKEAENFIVKIKGDKNSNLNILALTNYSDYSPFRYGTYREISVNLNKSEMSLFEIMDMGDNNSFSIIVQSAVDPVSIELDYNLDELIISDEVRVKATIQLLYEDQSSETITTDIEITESDRMAGLSYKRMGLRSKDGSYLLLSLTPSANSEEGVYSLSVSYDNIRVEKTIKFWNINDVAALCQASLSLEGQIGINLKVDISDAMLQEEGAYAELVQEGSSNSPIRTKIADAKVDEDTGYRIFTYPISAKEINDKITIRFYSENGKQLPLRGKDDRSVELEGNKYSYSATNYIVSKRDSSGAIGTLVRALGDYGTAAEKYFRYGSMGSVGINADLSTVDQTLLSPYKVVGSGDRLDGVSVSASLMLESMTSINVNYAITGNVADYTFTCDGKTVTPVKVGTEYQVTVSNIAAKDLDQMHVFSITDKTGKTQTVKYSALSYAYSKVNSTGDVSTVAKTLYLYNVAAKQYF